MHETRSASLPDQAVGIGPVMFPTASQATSRGREAMRATADILDMLQDFHMEAWAAVVTCMYIGITMVTLVTFWKKRNLLNSKLSEWTMEWLGMCWHFALTIVDQEILSPTIWGTGDGVAGYRLEDGNYTGLLGKVQRQEIDFVSQKIRPAVLQDEVVGIGPVLLPTGLQSISRGGAATRATNDILGVLQDLSIEALAAVAICIYIGITVVTFVTESKRTSLLDFQLIQWAVGWLDKCWHFALTVVDQEILSPTIWAIRFVWLSSCVAIFLVVFGFLLGMLSTDESVEIPSKRIETIYDLIYEPDFKDRPLMVFTILPFYTYLIESAKGTVASILYDRLKESDQCEAGISLVHCSFVETQMANHAEVTHQLNLMYSKGGAKGSRVLLVDKYSWDQIFRPLFCVLAPGAFEGAHSSRDFVVADYASTFYNKAADKQLLKRSLYNIATAVETAVLSHSVKLILQAVADSTSTDDVLKRDRCVADIGDDVMVETPGAFKLAKFKKTSVIISVMVVVSTIALILEHPQLRLVGRDLTVVTLGTAQNKDITIEMFFIKISLLIALRTGLKAAKIKHRFNMEAANSASCSVATPDEVDFLMHEIRPASLPDQVVGIGPVVFPTALQATSRGKAATRATADILDMLQDFHMEAWAAVVTCMYIGITMVTLVTFWKKRNLLNSKLSEWTMEWLGMCWHFALTIVDQEILSPTIWAIRFVWLSCCVAIFLVVFGFLLGILSTDESVEIPSKKIETIHDLIHEPDFKDRPLMMFTSMPFYKHLIAPTKGTDAAILYYRLNLTDQCEADISLKHCSFVETNPSDSNGMVKMMELMHSKGGPKGSRVLLVDKYAWELVLRPSFCILAPGAFDKAHDSRDFVLSDYAAFVYNKAADRHLLKRILYNLNIVTEAGLLLDKLPQLIKGIAASMPTNNEFKRFRCMSNMPSETSIVTPDAFKLDKFKKTSIIVPLMLLVSAVTLFLELGLSASSRWLPTPTAVPQAWPTASRLAVSSCANLQVDVKD
ncbi:hypothetical protein HDE_09652 [Halotydeus destructor]|nr:hypothetical protein HDE_09652 [Halotydeus destructor]